MKENMQYIFFHTHVKLLQTFQIDISKFKLFPYSLFICNVSPYSRPKKT